MFRRDQTLAIKTSTTIPRTCIWHRRSRRLRSRMAVSRTLPRGGVRDTACSRLDCLRGHHVDRNKATEPRLHRHRLNRSPEAEAAVRLGLKVAALRAGDIRKKDPRFFDLAARFGEAARTRPTRAASRSRDSPHRRQSYLRGDGRRHRDQDLRQRAPGAGVDTDGRVLEVIS
jgi:hypothetical protein